MSRIVPIGVQFDAAILGAIAASQQDLAAYARREHAKVMRAEPQPTGFRRSVDGVLGADEAAVKPFGVIEYRYLRIAEVVQFAMDTLFALSPVRSGDYRRAHTLFVRGAAVRNLKTWQPSADDEVYIINPLPYARKIEIGAMKMRVPATDQVYARASQIVDRRYGRIASIGMTYRPVFDAMAAADGVRSRAVRESNARRPALYIRLR